MKSCFILCGPTAVGKTSCSIELAQALQTEIISADSRQCYRELDIGVAKPTNHELELVRHHFINSHSIFQEVNAAGFAQYAEAALSTIFGRRNCAVMVGGTGLYIDAFCHGFDEIPEIDGTIRDQVRSEYKAQGIDWLKHELARVDPLYAASGEMSNPQRMMRALEVVLSTGASIRSYHQGLDAAKPYRTIKIGLELPRDELYQRINARVDDMVSAGLLTEAENLFPYRGRNALNTVGYKELFEFLQATRTLPEAIELIKQHTRHYAKRQLTWFRKDQTIKWFRADHHREILDYCMEMVNCDI